MSAMKATVAASGLSANFVPALGVGNSDSAFMGPAPSSLLSALLLLGQVEQDALVERLRADGSLASIRAACREGRALVDGNVEELLLRLGTAAASAGGGGASADARAGGGAADAGAGAAAAAGAGDSGVWLGLLERCGRCCRVTAVVGQDLLATVEEAAADGAEQAKSYCACSDGGLATALSSALLCRASNATVRITSFALRAAADAAGDGSSSLSQQRQHQQSQQPQWQQQQQWNQHRKQHIRVSAALLNILARALPALAELQLPSFCLVSQPPPPGAGHKDEWLYNALTEMHPTLQTLHVSPPSLPRPPTAAYSRRSAQRTAAAAAAAGAPVPLITSQGNILPPAVVASTRAALASLLAAPPVLRKLQLQASTTFGDETPMSILNALERTIRPARVGFTCSYSGAECVSPWCMITASAWTKALSSGGGGGGGGGRRSGGGRSDDEYGEYDSDESMDDCGPRYEMYQDGRMVEYLVAAWRREVQ